MSPHYYDFNKRFNLFQIIFRFKILDTKNFNSKNLGIQLKNH